MDLYATFGNIDIGQDASTPDADGQKPLHADHDRTGPGPDRDIREVTSAS